MSYKKILTVQDISCVGQCSLTVALPVISACGVEASVLPSAVLSTHTAGFKGYTFRDLSDDMPDIVAHWKKENIEFDAIYTGYLGSEKQIDYVKNIFATVASASCVKVVDPAMADNGSLYPGFDMNFVSAMGSLCAEADYVIPNITEAALMTGLEYKTEYDRAYIDAILAGLCAIGCKNVILTGISYRDGYTGVVTLVDGEYAYYEHEKMPKGSHGTGDIYASAFVGSLMNGKSVYDSARIAADFCVECIKETQKHENHWYGSAFEPVLYKLIEALK